MATYCPKHVQQAPGSSNCGPSALSMGIDFASLGVVRPKAETIRDVINDFEGGTNPAQWLGFCRKMGIVAAPIKDLFGLKATLTAGNTVVLAVDYGKWKDAGLPGHTTFRGWHALMIHPKKDGQIHLHDSLTTTGVNVDEAALFKFLGSTPLAIVVRGSRWLRQQENAPTPPSAEEERLDALLEEARREAEGVRVAAENTLELVEGLQATLANG